MHNEAEKPEEPATKSRWSQPTRAEILLVGTAWALFVFTLLAGLRIWTGPSQ